MLGGRRRILTGTALLTTLAALTIGAAAATAPAAVEPPLEATPPAVCGPGSRPEPDIQGRVPLADHRSGRAAEGYTCNTELVGVHGPDGPNGTVGGFKVERYVDAAGHECAYYDSTLLFPTNLFSGVIGTAVLDMADPAHPVLTDRLVTPAMLSPHESLVLSPERGLLAAVLGNPAVGPGVVDVYDVSDDCRHPRLLSSSPLGFFGHESGFAPDGRTFYAASPATRTIVAVNLDDPLAPVPIWFGRYPSHGLSVSDDGNRIYVASLGAPERGPADPGEGLLILDTSEIQARRPNPQVRVVSRLGWSSISIPQNAIPITVGGHPYVVEVDEFGAQSAVGAARIIDVADEANPVVVSNLRLAVHQPENFDAQADDPGAGNPFQGYAAHYCAVPRRGDPGIVACSMILSGLRVFDIRDPLHPREVAYFNAPAVGGFPEPTNFAMSAPAFVPERREIWYTDGNSGFYAVRVTNDAWPVEPTPADAVPASAGPAEDAAPAATAPATDDAAPLGDTSVAARTGRRSAVRGPSLPATGWALPMGAVAAIGLALATRRLSGCC